MTMHDFLMSQGFKIIDTVAHLSPESVYKKSINNIIASFSLYIYINIRKEAIISVSKNNEHWHNAIEIHWVHDVFELYQFIKPFISEKIYDSKGEN